MKYYLLITIETSQNYIRTQKNFLFVTVKRTAKENVAWFPLHLSNFIGQISANALLCRSTASTPSKNLNR